MKRITVLLADDHMIVREGLRKLLEIERDIEVIGEATTGREAVDMTRKLQPDVVVMDIAMPQLNGLEATRQIRQLVPATKILILSAHSDDAYVEHVTGLGVTGYLIKQTSAQVLAEAIREVQKGNLFFSPAIAKRHSQQKQKLLDRKGKAGTAAVSLTTREMEVLQRIAEGEANKQIAAALGISVKTIEKHRDHLMQKLDIHDTAGLTRYAVREGIIENSARVKIV